MKARLLWFTGFWLVLTLVLICVFAGNCTLLPYVALIGLGVPAVYLLWWHRAQLVRILGRNES